MPATPIPNTSVRNRPSTNGGRSRNGTQAPDFRLNFLPVSFSATTVVASTFAFSTPERLRERREQQREHQIIYSHQGRIYCVPITDKDRFLSEPRRINLVNTPQLANKLLQEAMLRFLYARGYQMLEFEPAVFLNRQPQQDLIAQALMSVGASVPWLHAYPKFMLSARNFELADGRPIFGLQVGIRTRFVIDLTVAELMRYGLNPIGRYVTGIRPPREGRAPSINPHRDPAALLGLLGRVRAVIGDRLLLDDAPEIGEISAVDAHLNVDHDAIRDCLEVAGVADPEEVMFRYDEQSFRIKGAEHQLQRVAGVAALFRGAEPLPIARGLTATVRDPHTPQLGADAGAFRKLPGTVFVFDPAGSKTAFLHDQGLEEHGPFDAEMYDKKRPVIAVVTPAAYKGQTEVFLKLWKDGIPRSKRFAQGFVRKYHLNDCTFRFETFEPHGASSSEAEAYRQGCLRALNVQPRPDLAFIIIEERHKTLLGDANPYLVAKSVFMSQGVPVQEVEIETIRDAHATASSTPFILNNVGLACYAKLGGIPFVISSTPALAHELVIGVGSAVRKEGRLTGSERFVGITTVFSMDGTYLLSNSSREVAYDDYLDALLETLRAAVEQVRLREAWQSGDTLRLIFHVFKPFKKTEARAVKRLVDELTEFQVEYAFLTLREDHDWRLFDRNAQGEADYQVKNTRLRGRTKGAFVPKRGYVVPLTRSEVLLTTTAQRQLTTPLHGAPAPLLIKLHEESTFTSMEYLAQQVYRFTSLSWRSFFPSSRPVTILYSDRIATLLGDLRHVRNWNADVLATGLRGSRWFL